MSSSFTELAVDCADPTALAAFWCAVLDHDVQETDEAGDLVTIGPRSKAPGAPVLTFARVPEPKTAKNRLHLDLNPRDRPQAEEVERLLTLGARRADVGQAPDDDWVVLADPEGNEFCVLAGQRPGPEDA